MQNSTIKHRIKSKGLEMKRREEVGRRGQDKMCIVAHERIINHNKAHGKSGKRCDLHIRSMLVFLAIVVPRLFVIRSNLF